jgi:hypothetical protein
MSSLTSYHAEHAHDFFDVAGTRVPRRYQSLPQEYAAAQSAAMMDRSFLGKVRVSGKDREALLHRLSTNEMRHLAVGESRVNMFTNVKGRVIDVFEMLALEDSYLLLASPGRAATVSKWVDKYTFIEDVKASDVTADWAVISLFGAEAGARAGRFFGEKTMSWFRGHFVKVPWRDAGIWVHAPQAGTIAQLNLIVAAPTAPALWQELLASFTPMGFEVYETLRIRQGIPAADHEIVEDYNPHEIGLLPFIDFKKGCYIGQEVIARLDSYQKVQRQLMGIQFDAPPETAAGAAVFADSQEIGTVTSAAHAITGQYAIGLAVIRKAFAQPQGRVQVRTPNDSTHAVLKTLPFSDDPDL